MTLAHLLYRHTHRNDLDDFLDNLSPYLYQSNTTQHNYRRNNPKPRSAPLKLLEYRPMLCHRFLTQSPYLLTVLEGIYQKARTHQSFYKGYLGENLKLLSHAPIAFE
jgi:hypothetical protein